MASTPWYMVGIGSYLAGVGLSFISPPLVVALMAATALYYAVDRLPGPQEADPVGSRAG